MKVLVDGAIYGAQKFGGISRSFTEALSRLERSSDGIEIILHLPPNCKNSVPKAKWIRQIKDYNLRPQTVFHPFVSRISKTRVRAMRPQIFHSTYYGRPYWRGLRSVVTVHDFIYEKYQSLLGDAQDFIEQKRYVIEGADAIIAVSHSTKEDILKYTTADEAKITVIYHGVSDAFLFPSHREEDKELFRKKHKVANPYWLYVGPRGLYKNFGTFLRTFVKVAPQTDGCLVAIGGEPKLEPWQVDLLIKNRLDQRVRLLSQIDDAGLSLAYSAAAALVFPSLAEGFGIPLLEAMACGTPIIAADIPVFREIAADAAFYFDPYDEEALAEAMIKVLNETTRERLVEKGHSRVTQFSWDTASRMLASIYKSLI
ncbi:MAG: hypothetical protein AMS15_07820 [Planctomycetes bacterium DG_23]|nr:MAG: hypothetical protein AMS15_07820 [Planctomycetes bacterium DG_23]